MIYLTGNLENKFSLNTGAPSGGAIECEDCTLTIRGCNSFRNNTASSDRYSPGAGGAIYIFNGDLVINNTTCTSGNKADVYLYDSTASIKGDEVNSATIGGAIGVNNLVMKLLELHVIHR